MTAAGRHGPRRPPARPFASRLYCPALAAVALAGAALLSAPAASYAGDIYTPQIALRPSRGPDTGTFHVTGTSPCASNLLQFSYTAYDGRRLFVQQRSDSTKSNAQHDYEFDSPFVVPPDARPGEAAVTATPACGNPDEKSSDPAPFAVTLAKPLLVITPVRPRPGSVATVSLGHCFGEEGRQVELQVRTGGVSRMAQGLVRSARMQATVLLPSSDRGTGTVSLPPGACEGTSSGSIEFAFSTAPPPHRAVGASAPAARAAPTPTATAAIMPSPLQTAPPRSAAPAAPPVDAPAPAPSPLVAASDRDRPRGTTLDLSAAALALLGITGLLMLRRRRRHL